MYCLDYICITCSWISKLLHFQHKAVTHPKPRRTHTPTQTHTYKHTHTNTHKHTHNPPSYYFVIYHWLAWSCIPGLAPVVLCNIGLESHMTARQVWGRWLSTWHQLQVLQANPFILLFNLFFEHSGRERERESRGREGERERESHH